MLNALIYRKKRKDRWWRFQMLKAAFIDATVRPGSGSRQQEALQRAFKALGYGEVSESLCAFWQELLLLGAARSSSLMDSSLRQIEEQAEALEPALQTAMCWLDLFRLCLGLGLFQTGRILRGKALERMVLDSMLDDADLSEVTLGCYSRLEQGRFDCANELLGRMASLGCSTDRMLQARWFCALMAGESERPGSDDIWASPDDRAFGDIIRGASVALVGPVASPVEQGTVIDAHDVVVKFGYRGGNQGRDPGRQGQRVDVAYYNNTQAISLTKLDYSPVFEALRWGVCHNRKGFACFPSPVSNLRLLTSLQWFIPDTHLNAGPNAVIDLLRFAPSGISIFNTDMMLSAGRFAGYRKPGDELTDYTRSFIKTHDPILQYVIMHRLWQYGYITGDDRFESVMAMGMTAYLDNLQQAYGADQKALF